MITVLQEGYEYCEVPQVLPQPCGLLLVNEEWGLWDDIEAGLS